jgi:hypothetical protein
MTINKHGLSRHIPNEISREIRQRCGFGCVICANAVVTYEHIDPPFADSFMHDPEKIALLCSNCHGKVTRGLISKATVLNHLMNPKSFEAGYSREAFDITVPDPTIEFCGTTYIGVPTIIAMMGTEILTVEPPEGEGAPMRISALFCDSQGSEIFKIVKNEWFSSVTTWDIDIQGPRIFFRRSPGDIALVIRAEPPRTIAIERISMYYKGARVIGREGSPVDAIAPNGARLLVAVKRVIGTGVGLFVDNDGVTLGYSGSFATLVASRR